MNGNTGRVGNSGKCVSLKTMALQKLGKQNSLCHVLGVLGSILMFALMCSELSDKSKGKGAALAVLLR